MLEMTQLVTVFKKLFSERTYGEQMEQYIISRHPKDAADVENFTREYQRNKDRSLLWN